MNYLTRKHLSRRTVLRGAGVALALPLLDAMVPAATAIARTAAAPKLRAGFFYMPHGAIMDNTPFGAEMDHWMPSGSGEGFKLSPILAPLEKYKRHVTSFSNLENECSKASVHVINPATWLSCVHPKTESAGADMSTTLDQLVAQKIGQDTTLPSLEIASETTLQVAACGGSTSRCYYSTTLAFRNAHSPLPMEYNPRKLFTLLFGEGDTAEERAALMQETASLLDLLREGTGDLRKRLGAADRATLDNHLESVREIERRVQMSQAKDLSGLALPKAPPGELERFDQQVALMFDLLALAYQTDLTRVATYMMVSEGTNRTYNFIGVPDAFHPLSHHANDRERLEKLVKVQRWHVERFADFIGKLAAMPDGENTVLDNALFLYGSNMSNSDRHNNYPLPNIVVGGGAGAWKGGRHVDLPPHTPLANLHLTLLNRLGIQQGQFADSNGQIKEA
ncbi:MAG: hypothetical protein RL026_1449 [Pseudomonadota bacterium]|jgi:hypothetical protein